MDYTLAVLTHGHSRTLAQTLRSFTDKVKPAPTRTVIHCDGTPPGVNFAAEVHIDSEQRGFCEATRRLWHWASDGETEHVFWLEHDFVFLRPVDLQPLAYTLDQNAAVCQMQLMRTPVSREEIAAGGLYQMRQDDYEQRSVCVTDYSAAAADEWLPWLHHRSYFTTNPSLMRAEFMALNPWPNDSEPQCEGRFSIDLVQRGFGFGVWGSGEPWVQHTGIRNGKGY